MNWYIATLIYRIVCADGNHTPQFDEQARLIQAEDKLEAFHKARHIGHQEEDTYPNDNEKPVRWLFTDVVNLIEFNAHTDGAEIFSRVHEIDHPELYLKKIKKYAATILEDCLMEIPQAN